MSSSDGYMVSSMGFILGVMWSFIDSENECPREVLADFFPWQIRVGRECLTERIMSVFIYTIELIQIIEPHYRAEGWEGNPQIL